MPKVRAVDEVNDTELRAELVSLLAEGVIPQCAYLELLKNQQIANFTRAD